MSSLYKYISSRHDNRNASLFTILVYSCANDDTSYLAIFVPETFTYFVIMAPKHCHTHTHTYTNTQQKLYWIFLSWHSPWQSIQELLFDAQLFGSQDEIKVGGPDRWFVTTRQSARIQPKPSELCNSRWSTN